MTLLTKVIFDIESGKDVTINLDDIIEDRALIQANSRGGKSYLVRKVCEKAHGKVQIILIDPEGEYATLREKFDFLLIGSKQDGADIQISVKIADLLAIKLLESGTSAIIDLSELLHPDKVRFVRLFTEQLAHQKDKKLWHPLINIIDECHYFAPEKGQGEAESSNAVMALASKGGKRGYALIAATQRPAKLSKNVTNELNTKFIGRAGGYDDIQRAKQELGLPKNTDDKMFRIKHEFYVVGPAISEDVIRVKAYEVETTHKTNSLNYKKSIIPTPQNIKKLLSTFENIPEEAEQELKTKEDLQRKVQELQTELRQAKVSQPKTDPQAIEKSFQSGYQKGRQEIIKQINDRLPKIVSIIKQTLASIAQIKHSIEDLNKTQENLTYILASTEGLKIVDLPINQSINQSINKSIQTESPKMITKSVVQSTIPNDNSVNGEQPKLRDGAMKMLKAVAMFHPKEITRNQVAAISGFSVAGGTFNTYLSELRRLNWINQNGESISITQEGLNNVGDFEQLPTDSNSLIDMWCSKFREGASKMLRVICEVYPGSISKEELGERTGFTPSGGTFNTYLSELRRNNLIEISGNDVIAAKELFP